VQKSFLMVTEWFLFVVWYFVSGSAVVFGDCFGGCLMALSTWLCMTFNVG